MNRVLAKLLGRLYREQESGAGDSGAGGSAPDASGSASTESSGVDWAALNDGVDPGADDNEEEGGDAPSPSGEAKPAPEAAADKTATTGDEPDATPPEDTAGDPPPEDDVEPVEQLTPEQIAAKETEFKQRFTEWRASEVERLSTKVYAFDEETAARLQTEPELVLPKLAAELELNAVQRAMEAVQHMLPQFLKPVLQSQDVEKRADDFFFGKNPDLKKYRKQVLEAGVMFRKLNPKATPEEAAEQIGNIVRTTLKIKAPAAGTAPAAKPAKAAPHKPAGAGSAPAPKPAKGDGSIWDDLIADD